MPMLRNQEKKSTLRKVYAKAVTLALTVMSLKSEKIKRLKMPITTEDLGLLRKRKAQRHKFGAVSCERDEKKFPSRLERRYYDQLKIRQKSGEVVFFLCQVPFDIGGGVKYVCDFQVFLADGSVEFIDTKGRDTSLSIAKRKIVEDKYPVEIKIVTKV